MRCPAEMPYCRPPAVEMAGSLREQVPARLWLAQRQAARYSRVPQAQILD
jgi:hypothetical protein